MVRKNIDMLVMKERAGLIAEAEAIMPQNTEEGQEINTNFPKYVVSREKDE